MGSVRVRERVDGPAKEGESPPVAADKGKTIPYDILFTEKQIEKKKCTRKYTSDKNITSTFLEIEK